MKVKREECYQMKLCHVVAEEEIWNGSVNGLLGYFDMIGPLPLGLVENTAYKSGW